MGPDGTVLFNTFDGKPKGDLVYELCAVADYVLALGTCASYGGIPAAPPNPTAAVGLQYADGQPGGLLGKDWRSRKGLPVVNVAGCAADADTMVLAMRWRLAGDADPRRLHRFGHPTRYPSITQTTARPATASRARRAQRYRGQQEALYACSIGSCVNQIRRTRPETARPPRRESPRRTGLPQPHRPGRHGHPADIEHGVRKASPGSYAMLENKLSWAPGSIDTILARRRAQRAGGPRRRINPNAPSQGYALRPTNANTPSQVVHRGVATGAPTPHHRPPRQTPQHLGRLGRRPRPARRLARPGLAAST